MKSLSLLMLLIVLVVSNLFWISHRMLENVNTLKNLAIANANGPSASKRVTHSLLKPQELEEQTRMDTRIIQLLLNEDRHDPYNRSNPVGIEAFYQAQSNIVEKVLTNVSSAYLPNFDDSYPDITIVGFQKAGTSQLFQILAAHPGTVAPRGKEYCVDGSHRLDYENSEDPSHWHRKLFQWHQSFHSKRLTTPGKKIINGCLQHDELEYKIKYNPPLRDDARFFFIFRDPADWMWAAFNYWYDYHLDANSPDLHDWLDPSLHYRSPELFHELVASRGNQAS